MKNKILLIGTLFLFGCGNGPIIDKGYTVIIEIEQLSLVSGNCYYYHYIGQLQIDEFLQQKFIAECNKFQIGDTVYVNITDHNHIDTLEIKK